MSNKIKIQKALLPAGAGIVALGAVIKIFVVIFLGGLLMVIGLCKWRKHKSCDKNCE